MFPEIELFERSIFTREVRFAIQLDIFPLSCTDLNSKDTTRIGRAVPQVTPCQLQKLSDSLLHDPRTTAEFPETPDLKQRRACRSSSDLLLVCDCADESGTVVEDSNMKRLHRKKCAWR